jgi:hypothetical protein
MAQAAPKPLPEDPPSRNPGSILLSQATEGELLKELILRNPWVRTDARTLVRWRR